MICVPIEVSSITGIASKNVNEMYIRKSPSVIVFACTALPPMIIITTAMAPMMTDENDEMAETPVTVFATFRNNLCAPRANDSSSRFSAV